MNFNANVIVSALALVAASCGQGPSNGGPGPLAGTDAAEPTGTDRAVPALADRRAAIPAAKPGSGLPMAKPAGSALMNAAYHRNGHVWEPLMFLCDGVNGEQVRLITAPNARGLSQLLSYAKPNLGSASEEVRIGDEDPGAGQIMRELRRLDGRVIGSVHSINPGILGTPDDTTLPTLSSITVGREVTPCRWMARGRVIFIDARRTILITAEPRGVYTYRSFDHAKPGAPVGSTSSVPTATVTGGRLIPSPSGTETYEFAAGQWTYRLTASADNRSPGATLTVLRSGKAISTSVALAYEMAAARRE